MAIFKRKQEQKHMVIKPHNTKSREVDPKDVIRVQADAQAMAELLNTPTAHGVYLGGYALAHSQFTDQDPLRFFVTNDGDIIINPVIVKHTKTTVPHVEGCLSYNWPGCERIAVPRWNKCVARWSEPQDDGSLLHFEENLDGRLAKIFQHEIDHMDGGNIYERAGKAVPSVVFNKGGAKKIAN